ncbi:Hypothetical protein POVN_LOCUS152, partial [uncultured virus]
VSQVGVDASQFEKEIAAVRSPNIMPQTAATSRVRSVSADTTSTSTVDVTDTLLAAKRARNAALEALLLQLSGKAAAADVSATSTRRFSATERS